MQYEILEFRDKVWFCKMTPNSVGPKAAELRTVISKVDSQHWMPLRLRDANWGQQGFAPRPPGSYLKKERSVWPGEWALGANPGQQRNSYLYLRRTDARSKLWHVDLNTPWGCGGQPGDRPVPALLPYGV
ncbi:unnamed protein product [Penicillium glandicola]